MNIFKKIFEIWRTVDQFRLPSFSILIMSIGVTNIFKHIYWVKVKLTDFHITAGFSLTPIIVCGSPGSLALIMLITTQLNLLSILSFFIFCHIHVLILSCATPTHQVFLNLSKFRSEQCTRQAGAIQSCCSWQVLDIF